jgi:hypothetical protein
MLNANQAAAVSYSAADRAEVARVCERLAARAYKDAKAAWRAVDFVFELVELGRAPAHVTCKARLYAQRAYGHRPCRKVGLKTYPFRVAKTRKVELGNVGRIRGGHKACGISAETWRWFER